MGCPNWLFPCLIIRSLSFLHGITETFTVAANILIMLYDVLYVYAPHNKLWYTINTTYTIYLPMLLMYRCNEPHLGRQHSRPPHSAAASLSTDHAKRELELGETYPLTGGSSSTISRNAVSLLFNIPIGPKTANELS